MPTLWDNCEPSTGFVQYGRSVRQYDLLLRCSFTRPEEGTEQNAFSFTDLVLSLSGEAWVLAMRSVRGEREGHGDIA